MNNNRFLPKAKKIRPIDFCLIVVLPLLFSGCANQRTLDSKVYRVNTASGTNYYRVRIVSEAWNSKAAYKPGLYPAYAVDAFLGVDTQLSMEEVDSESNLRKKVVAAQQKAFQDYIDAVTTGKSEKDQEDTAKRLLAVQELPLVTASRTNFPSQVLFTPLEFSPLRSLADHTANKKYVIALSADPDEILRNIAALAQEPATTKAVTDALGGMITASTGQVLSEIQNTQSLAGKLISKLEELAKTNVVTVEQLQQVLNEALTTAETLP